MKLDDLPRYIESPNGGMWRLPENFVARETDNIFVRLADVKKLLHPVRKWWEKEVE